MSLFGIDKSFVIISIALIIFTNVIIYEGSYKEPVDNRYKEFYTSCSQEFLNLPLTHSLAIKKIGLCTLEVIRGYKGYLNLLFRNTI